ncbi:Cu-binding protein [Scheffersomyces spartinae]|uniref:Cu-binding protein n=1 Tax=Scheffersomyces spartinae TaxID=45513 RepID=A0A9P7VC39_9ASCO|nr:Cu-binding protein [Scheffersomyces spartinae]KAG7195142.1 Cu-binding protein [Scheffersomyces spartinae]
MKVGIARNARGLTPRISLKNLQVSSVRFQHQKVNPPSEENKPANADAPKKRRPLSRVAIGGSQDHERKYAKGTIEFAAWKAILVLFGAGGLATWWFQREKERIRIQKEVESKRGIGKPLIGGPFSLVDTENKPFTNLDLVGDKFSILYFGFTHCPDVCPDELDKLGEVLDTLKKDNNTELQPVFITCDPARDSPEVVKQYLTDFHPSIIGLTGTYENVKNACKKYRVYFSTPPDVKPGQDYLVDHSIFFYLMDPEGNFVDVIGREATATEAVEKIRLHIDAFVPKEEMERRKDSWLSFLYK